MRTENMKVMREGEKERGWLEEASCDEILEFINKFHYDLRERRYYFVSRKLTHTATCPTRRQGDLHNCP